LVQNYTDNIFLLRVVLLTVKDSTTSGLIIAFIYNITINKVVHFDHDSCHNEVYYINITLFYTKWLNDLYLFRCVFIRNLLISENNCYVRKRIGAKFYFLFLKCQL
jgi:hypothetical protein